MKIKEWLLNQTTAKVVDLFITEYLKIDTELYDKDFDAIDSEDYIQFSLEEWLDSEKKCDICKSKYATEIGVTGIAYCDKCWKEATKEC